MKSFRVPHALAVLFACLVFGVGASAADAWLTDYPAALAQAKKENKLVLLDFTGSDWCPPCKIMKKRVFDSAAFEKYASENLVTVEVDFPNAKPQPAALQKQNRDLAKKYGLADAAGAIKSVPVLVLATPEGHELAVQKMAFFFPFQFIDWAKKAALKAHAKS